MDAKFFTLRRAPGISDDVVLEQARQASALLITPDKDFGELVFRQRRLSTGVLLLRLAGLSPQSKAQIVSAVVRDRSARMTGAFTVVSPQRVRIRSLPLG